MKESVKSHGGPRENSGRKKLPYSSLKIKEKTWDELKQSLSMIARSNDETESIQLLEDYYMNHYKNEIPNGKLDRNAVVFQNVVKFLNWLSPKSSVRAELCKHLFDGIDVLNWTKC